MGIPYTPGETYKCRPRLAPYCTGNGIDIGHGGDPITDTAIRIDLPQPYANVGRAKTQLTGDARNLHWFRDDVLDYVFSSHLLEDFQNTTQVLREWLRVLRPGGHLVLYCPDEQRYRQYCQNTGRPYNVHHVHENFSAQFILRILADIGQTKVIHLNEHADLYSWELVCRKLPPLPPE